MHVTRQNSATGYANAGTRDRRSETHAEIAEWSRIARASGRHPARLPGGSDDHSRCRLNFNLVSRDRSKESHCTFCSSQSIGPEGIVLICRRPPRPFEEVGLQLDDRTERPWIEARVVDCARTVGGYVVQLEYQLDAPAHGIAACSA